MVEFQSTLSLIKEPPRGYANEGVDIIAGLNDIGRKVSNGEYSNEYAFEEDISKLLVKAHDGHLGFEGMAHSGAVRWRRSRQISLISGSIDGKEAPKIWAIQDFNQTEDGWKRSAVTQINGKDVIEFLNEEASMNSYHDPDVRFNAMLYQLPAQNAGYFANPLYYPGPVTNVTFENGTSNPYPNSATILEAGAWSGISSGEDFFSVFVDLSSQSFPKLKKRKAPLRPPRHLQVTEADLDDESEVPVTYPDPDIEHSGSDVPLAGYFLDTDVGKIGVLMIQTFNTETVDDAEEFQEVIETFIADAKSQDVSKIVIDVRTNGGGLVMLGYDAYLQFFPTQEPQLLSRYRANEASDLIGQQMSTLPLTPSTVEIYTVPWNYHAYLDAELNPFESWEDMYGPVQSGNDQYTNLLRYNLSDPLVSSSDQFSVGITMTGYGNRASFRDAGDPFKPEDIVILTDGICASTCALFTELMVQQSEVKTIALGGRPQAGPMQAVGGTKGSLVIRLPQLSRISEFVVEAFASSNSERREWAQKLPIYTSGINMMDASVNFQDNIRKGLERDGIPTQFLNDTASCRVYYTPDEYLDVEALWAKVASVAFGNDGGLDEDACIAGSVTSRQAQEGVGPGSPTSPDEDAPRESKKGAAAGLVPPGRGDWSSLVAWSAVMLASLAFGASII
jgi:hypothetical protein